MILRDDTHTYAYIYIYIYSRDYAYIYCTEEATEMAVKYLHNKKCVFNNFE